MAWIITEPCPVRPGAPDRLSHRARWCCAVAAWPYSQRLDELRRLGPRPAGQSFHWLPSGTRWREQVWRRARSRVGTPGRRRCRAANLSMWNCQVGWATDSSLHRVRSRFTPGTRHRRRRCAFRQHAGVSRAKGARRQRCVSPFTVLTYRVRLAPQALVAGESAGGGSNSGEGTSPALPPPHGSLAQLRGAPTVHRTIPRCYRGMLPAVAWLAKYTAR